MLQCDCSSIVKQKYIILFFFTFLSLTLNVSHRLSLSLRARPSHSPHCFSHLTSLFLVQGLYWSWVWFVVTAWRLAWILDFGSSWIGGFLGGDWWVANVADDGLLKIADDGLDVVWCWRRWWRCWSGGTVGQMVSPIWVLWFRQSGFCVCFAVRHGLIFIY